MICIPIKIAIDKFINLHRAISSARTVQYYDETLRMFEDYAAAHGIYEIADFSQDNFLDYLQTLRNRGVKNTTVNTYTRGLRAFAHWCVDNDYLAKSFCDGVKQLRDDSSQVYPLTSKQVQDIDGYFGLLPFDMPECNNMTYLQERNYIMFHLMLDCGLRRQEVINLNIEDVQSNCIVINNSKYNKSRIVPVSAELLKYIRTYISYENRRDGPVLLNNDGSRISADSIRKVFYNISKNLHISAHPHLLRHTFATSYIAGGGNLEFLRVILGHATYNITQRYLHLAAQCTIADIDIYRLDSVFFKNYNNRNEV